MENIYSASSRAAADRRRKSMVSILLRIWCRVRPGTNAAILSGVVLPARICAITKASSNASHLLCGAREPEPAGSDPLVAAGLSSAGKSNTSSSTSIGSVCDVALLGVTVTAGAVGANGIGCGATSETGGVASSSALGTAACLGLLVDE